MMDRPEQVRSLEQMVEFLNDYASMRRPEITEKRTTRPLIKTYVLETFRSCDETPAYKNAEDIVRLTGNECIPIDDSIYHVRDSQGKLYGFLQSLDSRYHLLHSIQSVHEVEPWVERLVSASTHLDHMWIPGVLFRAFWNCLYPESTQSKLVKLQFQYKAQFEVSEDSTISHTHDDESPDDEGDMPLSVEDSEDLAITEHRVNSITLVERFKELRLVLPRFESIHESFYAMVLLRLLSKTGGHDAYHFGKITNRAASFDEHMEQVRSIVRVYSKLTTLIEDKAWLCIEPLKSAEPECGYSIKGAPVTFEFSQELDEGTFEAFVTDTFSRGRRPFRLWGNPIRLSRKKVHVYGLDLHLWQPIYMELCTKKFVFILPKGTCSNTIHRLATNIQITLDPKVSIFIGDTEYTKLSEMAIVGGDANSGTL